MRLSLTVALAVAILLLIGPAAAQDKGSEAPLNPDLPLEKPVPEAPPDEPPPDEEPPPEQAPPEQAPPEEAPPEEKPPENPPPEFFDEPIETGEVIFVIDRTGSMSWPSKMSVTDENGNPINNCAKVDVARIELIKTINELGDNMKFALVGYSAPVQSMVRDSNWSDATISWTTWPPAQGEPAPCGRHAIAQNMLPVWPSTKTLVKATPENKGSAISWAQSYLSISTVNGNTSIYDGMSVGLKMVSAAPPGAGPGGEPKKSATAIYLLTDGSPNVIGTTVYGCIGMSGWGSDETWTVQCMALTKSKILAENVHRATIYTLGIGMNMACPNARVWSTTKKAFDLYPTEYNDKCRKFLTELAEATGGHYREVSQ
jgi:hypothetical protein